MHALVELVPEPDGLLGEIARDLAADAALPTILSKCVLVGGPAGSADFRAWATKELRGYRAGDSVPAYRTVDAPICATGIAQGAVLLGLRIGPLDLPDLEEPIAERFTFLAGVETLEAILGEAERDETSSVIKIALPNAMRLAALIDNAAPYGRQLTSELFYSVRVANLRGILADIRGTLEQRLDEITSSK